MTSKLPWTMSGTVARTEARPDPATDPMNVTFRRHPRARWQVLFRKCCGCMFCNMDEAEAAQGFKPGQRAEFICGCGSHPSVMVCDGKVIGTSA